MPGWTRNSPRPMIRLTGPPRGPVPLRASTTGTRFDVSAFERTPEALPDIATHDGVDEVEHEEAIEQVEDARPISRLLHCPATPIHWLLRARSSRPRRSPTAGTLLPTPCRLQLGQDRSTESGSATDPASYTTVRKRFPDQQHAKSHGPRRAATQSGRGRRLTAASPRAALSSTRQKRTAMAPTSASAGSSPADADRR
jgi:hypothetical protein